MARRPIEIFSLSFLDLLSGALGAVILLYVIVPRLTVDIKELEEQTRLAEEVRQLGLDVEELKDLLPQDRFSEVQQQMTDLLQARAALESHVTDLQRKLAHCIDDAATVNQELAQAQKELEDANVQLQACNAEMEAIEGEGRFVLITIDWNTKGQDVDLHVVDPDGDEFNYERKVITGKKGELTLDNVEGPGLEVWAISDPPPGAYKVFANLYSKGNNPVLPAVNLKLYHRNGVVILPPVTLETADNTAGAPSKKFICQVDVPASGPITVN